MHTASPQLAQQNRVGPILPVAVTSMSLTSASLAGSSNTGRSSSCTGYLMLHAYCLALAVLSTFAHRFVGCVIVIDLVSAR